MSGCQTCGGFGGHHDSTAHGTAGEPTEVAWHCICGSGDDGEMHSLMCVASNTPDDEWYGDYPPRECDHENGECHDIEHQRRPPGNVSTTS